MGKPTGFMDYDRIETPAYDPAARVGSFDWFLEEIPSSKRTQQAGRCMDCGVPFCQAGLQLNRQLIGCPLHNLIPEWNDQLWHENLPMALERLLCTNCFPEFTGYVCPAPCEKACATGRVSSAVTIHDNERHIIETAFSSGLMTPHAPVQRSGLTVAVVGSGPAGLTVAQLLNQRGHQVCVYERHLTPGGLLVYGIPSMKLPKSVVARRIQLMRDEGVEFLCGVNVGKDVSVAQLCEQYDAVVLCQGAQKPRTVAFEGQASGVCFALDYLGAQAAAQLDEAPLVDTFNAQGKTVAVVGAGDSANDCIATALRQGAADVVQLIRRPAADYAPMTDYAHAEADTVLDHDIRRFQTTVSAITADASGALCSIELQTPEGAQTIPAELLVIASGFSGPEEYVTAGLDTAQYPPLFEAGDAATGASLVVQAMAHARQIAAQVDTYLVGYTNIK